MILGRRESSDGRDDIFVIGDPCRGFRRAEEEALDEDAGDDDDGCEMK